MNKVCHMYGERYEPHELSVKCWKKSILVNREDMGFFPMEVFQIYDPVACKKFFDQHSHDRPDQIVVHGEKNVPSKPHTLEAAQSNFPLHQ